MFHDIDTIVQKLYNIIVVFHYFGVKMKVCFIGHRKITINEELVFSLKTTIIDLINKGVTTFLFGSKNEFDDLAWELVTKAKETHPFIKRIYVRCDYENISKKYESFLLKSYEETYFPSKIKNSGKLSYVKRNCEMIDNANFCVFYYNELYVLQSNEYTKRNSGTKIAYEYAIKKNKTVINLFK